MHVAGRPARDVEQRHVRLFGRAIAFLDIALQASCHHVVPGVRAAARSRNDVVDSKVVAPVRTVLTRVVISVQQIASRQTYFFVWNFDVRAQSNDGRQREVSVDKFAVVLDLFGFAFHQKHHSTTPSTDV
jgi:hypothetical protein